MSLTCLSDLLSPDTLTVLLSSLTHFQHVLVHSCLCAHTFTYKPLPHVRVQSLLDMFIHSRIYVYAGMLSHAHPHPCILTQTRALARAPECTHVLCAHSVLHTPSCPCTVEAIGLPLC
jgi:hypothetical protein